MRKNNPLIRRYNAYQEYAIFMHTHRKEGEPTVLSVDGCHNKAGPQEEQGLSWRQTSGTSFPALGLFTWLPPSAYLHCLSLICLPMTRSPFHATTFSFMETTHWDSLQSKFTGLMTMVCIWTALGSGARKCLGSSQGLPWGRKYAMVPHRARTVGTEEFSQRADILVVHDPCSWIIYSLIEVLMISCMGKGSVF